MNFIAKETGKVTSSETMGQYFLFSHTKCSVFGFPGVSQLSEYFPGVLQYNLFSGINFLIYNENNRSIMESFHIFRKTIKVKRMNRSKQFL
jgi:hypothetical protein